ncbi:MAG TPA: NPP1 family protein [Kineosporiaceae bacterium]
MAVAATIAGVAASATWATAASIPHDHISRLTGTVSPDQARFLPLLEVKNGCQPYAAVQDDGSSSGGLNDRGSESGGCRGNETGQVIVRSQCESSGICAHMYALFFPKDQGIVGGVAVPGVGHRYEFENVVVWVKGGAIAAVSFSHHRGYDIRTAADVTIRGTAVSVQYDTGGDTTHSLRPGDGGGSPMPAPVSLESVSAAARATLNDPTTFGGIDFPEREDMFATKLSKARPSWL